MSSIENRNNLEEMVQQDLIKEILRLREIVVEKDEVIEDLTETIDDLETELDGLKRAYYNS
jgi:hypothetical protein